MYFPSKMRLSSSVVLEDLPFQTLYVDDQENLLALLLQTHLALRKGLNFSAEIQK